MGRHVEVVEVLSRESDDVAAEVACAGTRDEIVSVGVVSDGAEGRGARSDRS